MKPRPGTRAVALRGVLAARSGAIAHIRQCGDEETIATQMAAQGIDVMLGGGVQFLRPLSAGGKRHDGRKLLAEASARGVAVVGTLLGLRVGVVAPP